MDRIFLTYACDTLGDTENVLTGSEIIKYCNLYANDFNVSIPVYSIEMLKTTYKPSIPNKRTALLYNILAFNEQQQVKILNELCDLSKFDNNENVKKLKIKLNELYAGSQLDNSQIVETKKCLTNFDKSKKLYNEALKKYNQGIYQRNVLDDMRLSLELLIRELVHNEKPIEKQIQPLCELLKNKDVSDEIRNSFSKVIEYYTKYQNRYVKHNDFVKLNEMEWIINQTSIMIQFLVKNAK